MPEETAPERGPSGRMTDAEVDAFLREQGTGVLALASGDRAYAIPVSFGYETGRAVFAYWRFGSGSTKAEYTAATEEACLTVYDVASAMEWRSVVARGPLHELSADEWDDLGGLLDDNAWSPDFTGVERRRLSIDGYELRIDEATGLRRSPDTGGE
jgi:nitroimidazol reductase NimA-like FMN-containing flavoprotein (pyridoxamine 5'-phosphate oxidase superfamily)